MSDSSEGLEGRHGFKRFVLGMKESMRAFAVVGLPFAMAILYLALHRARKVPRVNEIAYERTLILNLVLYWMLASLFYLALRHRKAFGQRIIAAKAPLVLLAFSTLLSFAFAEVALRILRPHAAAQPFERLASESLHHRNAPDRRSLGMGDQWVETNPDGFRTSYDRASFLELEHRVVLLGDSYTFGLGVAEEESVAAVLEDRLRQHLEKTGKPGRVGVLNTGVISYSPLLVRQAFREVVHLYRPTTTFLLVDANDIGDDFQYERESLSGDLDNPRFDVPPSRNSKPSLCDRSVICRTLGPVWSRLGKPRQVLRKVLGKHREAYDYYAFEAEVDGVKERNRFFILRHPLDSTRPYFERSWGYIEDIASEVSSGGSEFVLVVMPRYFHWNDAECPENWESDRYGVNEPHENAFLDFFDERIADSPLFPIWSLLNAFKENSQESGEAMVFQHDPHWNVAGHRVAAEALVDGMLDAGWPSSELSSARSLPSSAHSISEAPFADGGAGRESQESEEMPPRGAANP